MLLLDWQILCYYAANTAECLNICVSLNLCSTAKLVLIMLTNLLKESAEQHMCRRA